MSNDELGTTEWQDEICFIDVEGKLVTVQIPEQVMLHAQRDLNIDLGFINKQFSSARLARTLLILLVMFCSRPAKHQHRLHHTSPTQTTITFAMPQIPELSKPIHT
jgi:hypothetical protein